MEKINLFYSDAKSYFSNMICNRLCEIIVISHYFSNFEIIKKLINFNQCRTRFIARNISIDKQRIIEAEITKDSVLYV